MGKNLKKELKYLRKNADKFYDKIHPAEAEHKKLVSSFLKNRLKYSALEKEKYVLFNYKMTGVLHKKGTKEEVNVVISLEDYIDFAKDNKLKIHFYDENDKRIYSKKEFDKIRYVLIYF